MPKHPRKRQKTTNDASSIQNALLDESSKDDEERRLESLLFGTKFVPSTQFHPVLEAGASKEMQNLTDTDVLIIHTLYLFFSDWSSCSTWTTASRPRLPTLTST
jgi:U3 small nucleolar RNA-associated protein 18